MRDYSDADEDWLDDKEHKPRPKASEKKPREGKAKVLAPSQGNAVVTEIFPNQCAARLDGAPAPALFPYVMATLAERGPERERSPVCVGDRVRVENGAVVGRCERRNRLMRPAPNARNPLRHAVVANVDLLVVVAAARSPEFTGGIVDRFLVAASIQEIPAALCVNKADLLSPSEPRPWSAQASAGVRVLEVSAEGGSGLDELRALVTGKTVVFCGHSGVGKTSLLKKLLGADLRTGEISAFSGKGRHTTTGAVLLPGPSGSSWIDTPGIMNFGLLDVDAQTLLPHFPELHRAARGCAPGCFHELEPGCAVKDLPRADSFRRIRADLS